MPKGPFRPVDEWIFDLDNTLYPADCNLFAQIDSRMTAFIAEMMDLPTDEARKVQKDYYVRYGTTLSGLMICEGIKPEAFMDYVHDIDLTPVQENGPMRAALKALPGKRYIFTNGSIKHAENVASKIGILDLFDGLFDVAAADFTPKPHAPAYDAFTVRFGVDPSRAAFFEDMPQNLEVPHAAGMRTVLVQSDVQWFDDEPAAKRPARPGDCFAHVHHVTSDLTGFLSELTTPPPEPKNAAPKEPGSDV